MVSDMPWYHTKRGEFKQLRERTWILPITTSLQLHINVYTLTILPVYCQLFFSYSKHNGSQFLSTVLHLILATMNEQLYNRAWQRSSEIIQNKITKIFFRISQKTKHKSFGYWPIHVHSKRSLCIATHSLHHYKTLPKIKPSIRRYAECDDHCRPYCLYMVTAASVANYNVKQRPIKSLNLTPNNLNAKEVL